jgi:hypothetical protein
MSLKGTDVEPEKATAFLATFVQNSQGNISAIEKIDEELFEIGRAAKQLQYQAAERKGGTDGHVVIVLHSKLAMTADICLSYCEWIYYGLVAFLSPHSSGGKSQLERSL